jgi:hypothetical protein
MEEPEVLTRAVICLFAIRLTNFSLHGILPIVVSLRCKEACRVHA